MKRIIALIIFACCCCVHAAYSLVQPLSLTQTSSFDAPDNGNTRQTTTINCSDVTIDPPINGIAAIDKTGLFSGNSNINCNGYDKTNCNITNQGSYYFCYTNNDNNLDSCTTDYIPPSSSYEEPYYTIPCSFGTAGSDKKIVGFDKPICEIGFDDYYNSFSENQNISCNTDSKGYCATSDLQKEYYYCTSNQTYSDCGNNDIKYFYDGEYTEPCLKGKSTYSDKAQIIAYAKKSIQSCSDIFFDDIISLLSSDGNCKLDHETKSCVLNGVTKYYCSAIAGGAYCSGDFILYYDDTYTETCLVETKDYSPAVGYKNTEEEAVPPEYCSDIFTYEIINALSEDEYINCGTTPFYMEGCTDDSGTFKLYCATAEAGSYARCDGDYKPYQDVGYTELCSIDQYSYGNNFITVIGYKKPEVTCQDVFEENTSSIIGILPEKSTIACDSYVSGSCTYDSKVYSFCYGGVTITNACPNNPDEYSREYTSSYTEPCSYTPDEPDGDYNGMGINILGFTQKDTESCEYKIENYLTYDHWLYVKESDLEGADFAIRDNFITDTCIDNDIETNIYRICTFEEVCSREDVNGSTSSCNYDEGLHTCKCPNGWMAIEEYRSLKGYTPNTIITGIGNACKAEKVEKFSEFDVFLGIDEYPSCQDIIEHQNASGDPTQPKDGYYDYCLNGIVCYNSDSDTLTSLCPYCGADDATSNDYDFSKSFKINADNNPCLQGCHEDYACSYTKTDGTTITYCSQCDCSGYASKLELCSVGFEGEENNTEILASPCYTSGKVDENESCKLSPIDNTLPTMYKKILCPGEYVTLEDWLGTSQSIIDENKFLGNNLNISNENQWINYFVPQTDEGSVCDYAVEVVESGSGGTDVDSDIEDTNDPGNRSYSGGSDNLEGYEIKSLEAKYKGFNLSCQALVETLPNLEFINQAYLHNYNYYTICWDIEGNQEKYLATCHEDYLLPEEGYEVIGNEDVCKFNGKDYYKYGGSCPVIFSGKEAVVPESTSDDAIRTLYGSVKISPCNDNGTKMKVTYCDPSIYNQICEYPYVYAYPPEKIWCRRNVQGKAVDPGDTANNIKYYTNTGLPVQCNYVPKSCNSMLLEDGIANNVFIEDSPNDCIKKYGTAVQTKLCSGDNNIPKYACYYPKDTYKWTTQNCPIGRDLSRPYILINSVKHWDRCDCPPAYKYHVNNCRVYDLGGDTCEQEIDSHFIDTANDPTLPLSGSIKLYTKCNDPQINQPNGCKTPLGTWAKCYYCCPKGTRATGNLSIDSCGAKIYECK